MEKAVEQGSSIMEFDSHPLCGKLVLIKAPLNI